MGSGGGRAVCGTSEVLHLMVVTPCYSLAISTLQTSANRGVPQLDSPSNHHVRY